MNEGGALRGTPASAKALEGPRSALGGARDRRLDVLIRHYAQMQNSQVALLCQLDPHRKPRIISSWGIDGAPERIVGPGHCLRRGRRGSFIRRALAHGHP